MDNNQNNLNLQRELERTSTVLRTVLDTFRNSPGGQSEPGTTSTSSSSPVSAAQNLRQAFPGGTVQNQPGSRPASAVEDFRQAFPGLCSRNVSNKRPKTGTETKNKRPMLGYLPFKAPETWTHDFCVLGRCDEETSPSRERMDVLLQAGLGRLKVVFPNKRATHRDVETFLEQKFPKLKQGGGFHVLRAVGGGGGQRPLSLLQPGKDGYSVPFMKERLGQAIGFIRPLQVDLDEAPVELEVAIEDSPKVSCVNCGLSISMAYIKDHQKECRGGTSQQQQVQQQTSQDVVDLVSRNQDLTTTTKESVGSSFDTLAEMFPCRTTVDIQSAIDVAGGEIEKAINVLLGNGCSGNVESDDDLMESAFEIEECVKQNLSLDEVLSSHRKALPSSGWERFTIKRENLWQESIAIFKNPMLKTTSLPMVTFEGENGIDAGGLRKEYGTLLLKCMFSSDAKLFEGKEDRKVPMYSMEGLQSRLFQVAGKMVAYSIVHLDIGIPCLSPCVYEYIVSGSLEHASNCCSVDDLCEYEIKELTEKVIAASSTEELQEIKKDSLLIDGLVNAGFLNDLNMENKSLAMQSLLIHSTIIKRKEPLDQFIKGLGTLGILSLIRDHPQLMKKYFIASESTTLTSEDLIAQLAAIPNEQEEKSYNFLLRSIKKIEEHHGSTGLGRFLHYMTGLTKLPPLGLNLQVPTTHNSFEEFMEKVEEACDNCTGFGSA